VTSPGTQLSAISEIAARNWLPAGAAEVNQTMMYWAFGRVLAALSWIRPLAALAVPSTAAPSRTGSARHRP